MGFFRQSTPTGDLELITYTMPLWLHVRQEAVMAYSRTAHLVKIKGRMDMQVYNKPLTVGHRHVDRVILDVGFDQETIRTLIWSTRRLSTGTGRPWHMADGFFLLEIKEVMLQQQYMVVA